MGYVGQHNEQHEEQHERHNEDADRDLPAALVAVQVGESEPMPQRSREPDRGGDTGTAVLERPETAEQAESTDNGDADRFAHYVSKDRIMESRRTGRPVVALCGKIWVPKHDPSKYPVCPDCKRIYEQMQGK